MTPVELYDGFRAETWRDTWHHLPFFREVARGIILEIGTHAGTSTSAFLCGLEQRGGHIYSLDIDSKCPAILSLGGHPQWTFTLGDSKDLGNLPRGVLGGVDILFIDGDHTYEGASRDVDSLFSLIRPGGLLLMHDCGEVPEGVPGTSFVGVQKAFKEICEEHAEFRSYLIPESWGLGVMEVGGKS